MIESTVFVQRELPANSILQGGSFQLVHYDGPVEVDWTAGPASLAVRESDTLLIFDRAGIPISKPKVQSDDGLTALANWSIEFFWTMAPISVKYAARGNLAKCLGQISLLDQSLRQLADFLGRAADKDLGDLDDFNAMLGKSVDASYLLEQISERCKITESWASKLTDRGVATPEAMPRQLDRLIRLAESEIDHAFDPMQSTCR